MDMVKRDPGHEPLMIGMSAISLVTGAFLMLPLHGTAGQGEVPAFVTLVATVMPEQVPGLTLLICGSLKLWAELRGNRRLLVASSLLTTVLWGCMAAVVWWAILVNGQSPHIMAALMPVYFGISLWLFRKI